LNIKSSKPDFGGLVELGMKFCSSKFENITQSFVRFHFHLRIYHIKQLVGSEHSSLFFSKKKLQGELQLQKGQISEQQCFLAKNSPILKFEQNKKINSIS
jgi:hypothetical protein